MKRKCLVTTVNNYIYVHEQCQLGALRMYRVSVLLNVIIINAYITVSNSCIPNLTTTYKLNRCSNVAVQNDFGKSGIFHKGKSVKQGTIWAAPIRVNFNDKGFKEIEVAKHLVLTMEQ